MNEGLQDLNIKVKVIVTNAKADGASLVIGIESRDIAHSNRYKMVEFTCP
jgi:hypothetical protein